MKRLLENNLLPRLLIPLIVISLLGLAPRPHEVFRLFEKVRSALELDSPDAASVSLSQAAEHIPWRTDLWELAGHYALTGDAPRDAIRYLEKAASLNSLSFEGQVALGDAHQQIDDLPAAIQTWEALTHAGSPSSKVYLRLLQAHRALGNYQAAISDLRTLTAIQPSDARLRYQLGLLLAAQHPESALAHLIQAADIDPDLADSVQTLENSIRTARLADDPAYTMLMVGRALASLDEWELASITLCQAAITRPDYAEAWAFLGEARQHLGLGAESRNSGSLCPGQGGLPDLQKALSLDPESLSANTLLALYWQRQDRYDLALDYIKTATNLYPRNPTLQVELGSTLATLGDLSTALLAYQHAVELAPRDPTYLRVLANFSIKHEYQLRQVGLPAARQAVIIDPDDPASLDVMGQILFLLNDSISAERFFNRSLQADRNYAPAHLHLGLIYILQGDSERALHKWVLARALAPGTPIAEQSQRLLKNYFP